MDNRDISTKGIKLVSGDRPLLAQKPRASFCPTCGHPGKAVPGQTVKALISISLRDVSASDYYFCRTETCPVVYFTAGGSSMFTTHQVRETVFQKASADPNVKVCYCFQHTVGEVVNGSPEQKAKIIAEIQAGISAGLCACDLRNPQGSCCLGNVRKLQNNPAPA